MEINRKAKITMQTKIHWNEEPEVFELTVFGEVIPKGKSIYFRYIEQTPEGEVKNTVKYNGNDIAVIRGGALKMRQNFIKGLETSCLMQGPMGNIHLMMNTNSIRYSFNEKDREHILKFVYHLTVQFEPIGMYEITLTASEENNL